MDQTDRISFSKSYDLAGENNLLEDPGQDYIAKAINIGRFFDRLVRILVDFGILWGSLGRVLGVSLVCFS